MGDVNNLNEIWGDDFFLDSLKNSREVDFRSDSKYHNEGVVLKYRILL